MKRLSIIIPAYNEEKTILELLTRVVAVSLINNLEKEIIVIDDGSTDGTRDAVNEFISQHPQAALTLFQQTSNRGKGAAINRGIEVATGEYLIIQDADLEYNPQEYNLLLEPVFLANADVVYGSRFMGHHPHRILFYWHSIGNRFLTGLSNLLNNLNLSDMETCYKLIRTSLVKNMQLREKRFGIEPELTAKLAKIKGVKIYEVGISYYGRTYEEGKKISWKDGFRAMWCIVRYRFGK